MNAFQSQILDRLLYLFLSNLYSQFEDIRFKINFSYNNSPNLFSQTLVIEQKILAVEKFQSISRLSQFRRHRLLNINLKDLYSISYCHASLDIEKFDFFLSFLSLDIYDFFEIINIPYGYVPIQFQ